MCSSDLPPAPTVPVAASAQAPAPAREPDAAEAGGEPMVDGVRLSRWLADQLAHAIARPQAGITGFDARLAPGWPGAMQGPWGWGG